MSFFVWCEIVCQKCSRTVAGTFTTGQVPRARMAEEARDRRWEHNRDTGEWMCPSCKGGGNA